MSKMTESQPVSAQSPAATKNPEPAIASRKVISAPNAAIKVTELVLSDRAKCAIRTGVPKLGDVK